MSLRKIASLTALLSFALLAFTSVVLYIAPHGRRSGQWEWLELSKHEWQAMHTNLGILLLAACIIHMVLNIRPIVSYLRTKEKTLRVFTLNFNIALLLTAWIVVSTLFEWPPVSAIQTWEPGSRSCMVEEPRNETEEPAEKTFPDRPPFRFGSRTLAEICEKYGLDQQATLQSLRQIGINAKAEWTIKTIAQENDMQPHSLFDTLRQLQER
jgi:hypothetical protein